MATADNPRERYLTLKDACKLHWLPRRRNGRALATGTLLRWIIVGLAARDGLVRKLKSARCGNTTCTKERWLEEFFEGLAADPEPQPQGVPPAPHPPQPDTLERLRRAGV